VSTGGPIGFEISQVAMVVSDLEASMRAYNELHGWGPWNVYRYEPPRLRDLRIRGEEADGVAWIGGEAEVGSVWVELLQPLGEDPVFGAWLAAHGEGVHHLGYWARTFDEADRIHERLAQEGAAELLSAWIDDVRFFYMDTKPAIVEVWAGDLDSLQPVRIFPDS
jgi:methylmalonyl-CoA/ethylmalonyl-CoA epimerase